VFTSSDSTCALACDGSLERPYLTIQEAVNVLDPLDNSNTVVLLPGIYTGTGNTVITPPYITLTTLYALFDLSFLLTYNSRSFLQLWMELQKHSYRL